MCVRRRRSRAPPASRTPSPTVLAQMLTDSPVPSAPLPCGAQLVVVVEGPPPSKCPLPLHAASKCTKCYPPSGGDEAAAVVMCYPKFSVQKRPGDKQIQLAVKRAHVDLQPPVSEDDKTLFMRVEKTAWLPEAPLTDRRLANPLTIQAKSFSAATDVGPSSWQLRFGLAVEDVEEEYQELDLTPPTATG